MTDRVPVDPQFRQARQLARKRHRKRLALRLTMFGGPVLLLTVPLALFFWPETHPDVDADVTGADQAFSLVQMESDIVVAPVAQNNAFINIPGDPMILRFASDGAEAKRETLPGPGTLDIRRFGLPEPARMTVVRDDLVVQERRLMTSLPSTREDFAFFQAQRNRSLIQGDMLLNTGALPEIDEPYDGATAGRSAVENTTSVSFVRREALRTDPHRDVIVQVEVSRSVSAVLRSNGFQPSDAEPLAQALTELLPDGADTLPSGSIVAVRYRPRGDERRVLQASLYSPDGYLVTVAQTYPGRFVSASDPWIDDDLMSLSVTGDGDAGEGSYRLLDALYSAAIRNGVPTNLVGEIIVMFSQVHDLDRTAATGDRVTFAYAEDHGPGGNMAGQIAYVGIRGPSGRMSCYVVPNDQDGGYRCHAPDGSGGFAGGGALMTPVSGILTSRFGPRKHPIHQVVQLHAGVDWAAPTGTPVFAAADGRVISAGEGGAYGNVVSLSHTAGVETRYAHLDRFAEGLTAGRVVRRGDIIGYVGNTGQSTGPHLHFEVRRNGEPTDPMPLLSAGQGLLASNAVEALIDQIIRVESAGDPNARNVRSTATGLGQFIESTWMRMMRTYRPDLVESLSREDLLALRRDPTLSREMVKKLAQENESYLRARGHQITPGRLYLAHFLGPEGAHQVLGAPHDQTIRDLMGAAVVTANPFLREYSVADLRAWANRKMRGHGGMTAPPPPPASPEVQLYMAMIDEVLQTGS